MKIVEGRKKKNKTAEVPEVLQKKLKRLEELNEEKGE